VVEGAISHYRVESRIGVGGMGEVFRAYDTQLERPVAIKRLRSELNTDPTYRQRFLREARHAAQITHHSVAGIHDVLEWEGELFLVMEYVEGEDLSSVRLDRSVILPLLKIAIQCAEGLVAAHQIGLIHRDIKPANIMLTVSGDVKILDFGLARRFGNQFRSLSEDQTPTTEITADVGIQGTLAYMAPEVLRGWQADHRSDLFSMGVVFYQLLTGSYPFEADSRPDMINKILTCTPPPVVRLNHRVPLELDECVFRLLEKDPQLRYATAADLLAHLRKIERDTSFDQRQIEAVTERRSWLEKHRLALGTLTIILAVLSAFLLFRALIPPPIPAHPVIAVLPFYSDTDDAPSLALVNGLREMVNQRLNQLSLTLPFTTVPGYYIRETGIQTPQESEGIGANLALVGRYELQNGNATVQLQLTSAESARVIRQAELIAPLSESSDLEYAIIDNVLSFLRVEGGAPVREIAGSYPASQAAYDYFLRGLGHYCQKQYTEAVDNFDRSLLMEPNLALAKAYLGLARLREGPNVNGDQAEAAEKLCLEARSLDRRLQVADVCLAEAAAARGDFETAAREYESAIQGPEEYEILSGFVGASRKLGRLQDTIPTLDALVNRQPELWMGYNFIAWVHYLEGDFESAIRAQIKSVEMAPRRADGYKNLGVYYDLFGCPEGAIQSYESALSLKRHSSTYTNLAVTCIYSGNYTKALEAAQDARTFLDRESEPSYTEAGNLGDIYYWSPSGNRETALTYYREAVEEVNELLARSPGELSLTRSKCWYLAMLGEEDSAVECVNTLLAFPDPDYETCYRLALIYQRLGKDEKALEYLKLSLEEGMRAGQVRHEPIFRENPAVTNLLDSYTEEPKKCP